jgi:hypothetical protein
MVWKAALKMIGDSPDGRFIILGCRDGQRSSNAATQCPAFVLAHRALYGGRQQATGEAVAIALHSERVRVTRFL